MALVNSCSYESALGDGNPAVITGLGTAATAGNLIVIWVMNNNLRELSGDPDDGSTTAFARTTSRENGGAGMSVQVAYGIAAGSGAGQSITMDLDGGGATGHVYVCEFSGANASQAGLTQNGATPSSATTHDSGAITPPTSPNVCVYGASLSGDYNVGPWTLDTSEFTTVTSAARAVIGYRLNNSGSCEANLTSVDSRFSALSVVGFAGAGGATAAPGGLLLRGIGGAQ